MMAACSAATGRSSVGGEPEPSSWLCRFLAGAARSGKLRSSFHANLLAGHVSYAQHLEANRQQPRNVSQTRRSSRLLRLREDPNERPPGVP
jgi:hypothetical protein